MSATPLPTQSPSSSSSSSSSSRSPTRRNSPNNSPRNRSPPSPSSRVIHHSKSNNNNNLSTSTHNVQIPTTSINSSRTRNRSHQEALLPSGAIVRVTGNNRTKQELVGRTGEVILATMLGGWHQVRLSNNNTKDIISDQPIVRLQRNALEVLSLPDNPSHLVRLSNSPKSDHHQKQSGRSSLTITPSIPPSPSGGITKYQHGQHHHHQNRHSSKHNFSPKRIEKSRESNKSSPIHTFHHDSHIQSMIGTQSSRSCVVIANLNMESLQRYRRTFNLKLPNDCSREDLITAASKHFEKISVNEPQVIADFIATISKRHRNTSRSHPKPTPHSQMN